MHPLLKHSKTTEEERELGRISREYYSKFKDRFPTQPSGINVKKQVELMRYCIEIGKTYEEVTGDVYDGVSKQ